MIIKNVLFHLISVEKIFHFWSSSLRW